jgi:hypothetical protein
MEPLTATKLLAISYWLLAIGSFDAPAAQSIEPWTPPSGAVENHGRGQAKALL